MMRVRCIFPLVVLMTCFGLQGVRAQTTLDSADWSSGSWDIHFALKADFPASQSATGAFWVPDLDSYPLVVEKWPVALGDGYAFWVNLSPSQCTSDLNVAPLANTVHDFMNASYSFNLTRTAGAKEFSLPWALKYRWWVDPPASNVVQFKVDATPPQRSGAGEYAGVSFQWTKRDANAIFQDEESGLDPGSFSWSIDGAAWTTDSFVVEGAHTIRLTARDRVGNSSTATWSAAIDRSPPTLGAVLTSGGSPLGSSVTKGPIRLSISAAEAKSWESGVYSVSCTMGTSVRSVVGSSLVVDFDDSSQAASVVITAKDKCGNEKTITLTELLSHFDSVPPTQPTIRGTVQGSAFSTPPLLREVHSDAGVKAQAAGVDYSQTVSWALDGVAVKQVRLASQAAGSEYNSDYQVPLATESGLHWAECTVRDAAGNESHGRFDFVVDREGPVPRVVWVGGTPGTWSNTPLRMESSWVDAGAGLSSPRASEYRFYTKSAQSLPAWTSFNGTLALGAATAGVDAVTCQDGTYRLDLRATDLAGNIGSASFDLMFDRTAPVVLAPSGLSPTWGDYAGVTLALRATSEAGGSALDSSSRQIEVLPAHEAAGKVEPSGAAVLKVGATLDPEVLSDGLYLLRCSQRDEAGNAGSLDVPLFLDRTPPSLTASCRFDAPSGNLVVSLTAVDPLSGPDAQSLFAEFAPWQIFEASGGSLSSLKSAVSGTQRIPAQSLAEGAWTLVVSAADAAGNHTSETIPCLIDRSPPLVSAPTSENWTNQTSLTIGATDPGTSASGIGEVTYSWNAGAVTTWDGLPIALPEGSATLEIDARDRCGNLTHLEVNTKSDRLAPLAGVVDRWYGPGLIELFADDQGLPDASGVAGLSYSLDGTTWTEGTEVSVGADFTGKIFLRAMDRAGNSSTATAYPKFDSAAPVITAKVPACTRRSSGTDVIDPVRFEIDDGEAGFTQAAVVKCLLDGAEVNIACDYGESRLVVLTPLLAMGGLGEGEHRLEVSATDRVGNRGLRSWSVLVDRTAPEITSFRRGDQEITGASTVFATHEVTLALDYRDGLSSAAQGFPLVEMKNGGTMVRQLAGLAQVSVDLQGLPTGLSQLEFRLVDASGNAGAWQRLAVLVDPVFPQAPRITCTTHPRAATREDARPNGVAAFVIRPGTSPSSGLASYRLRLLRGSDATGWEPLSDSVKNIDNGGGSELAWQTGELPDNDAVSVYRLEVSEIGVNGLESAAVSWPFRVDSTPPDGLRVAVDPDVGPPEWGVRQRLGFTWNTPADASGVASYRSTLISGIDLALLGAGPEEIGAIADAAPDWSTTLTNDRTVELARDSVAWAFVLDATDSAGNSTRALRTGLADNQPPDISGGLNLTRENSNLLRIDWDKPTDPAPGSGVDYIDVLVQSASPVVNRHTVLDSLASFCELDGLPQGAYYVTLRVADRAGNKTTVASLWADEGYAASAGFPCEVLLAGFAVRGERFPAMLNGSSGVDTLAHAVVALPDWMRITAGESGATAQVLEFPSLLAVAGGFAGSVSFDRPALLAVPGFTFGTSEASIDDGGLFVREALTDFCSGEKFLVKGLRMKASDGSTVTSSSSVVPAVNRPLTLCGRGGITLESSTSMHVAGRFCVFENGRLDLDALFPRASVSAHPAVSSVECSVEGEVNRVAFADTSWSLVVSGIEWMVDEARIEAGKIILSRAHCSVQGQKIAARDIVVDAHTGRFETCSTTSIQRVTIAGNSGETFSCTVLHLDDAGTLIADGRLDTPILGGMDFEGLALSASGLAASWSASVAALNVNVAGFLIRAEDLRYGYSGVSLGKAWIAIEGVDHLFRGVVLDPRDGSVSVAGTCADVFSMKQRWSAGLSVGSLRFAVSGLQCALRVNFPGSVAQLELARVSMDAGGELRVDAFTAQTAAICGTPLEILSIDFDGRVLRVNKARVLAGEILKSSDCVVQGLALSCGSGLVLERAGVLDRPAALKLGSWQLQMTEAGVGLDGLEGTLSWRPNLPALPAGVILGRFILGDGLRRSGGSGAIVPVSCWLIGLSAPDFAKDPGGEWVLRDTAARVLCGTEDDESVPVGEVFVRPDDTMASISPASGSFRITTLFGLLVEGKAARVVSDRIVFSGVVHYGDSGNAVPVRAAWLDRKFALNSGEEVSPVAWTTGAWTISATGVVYQDDVLTLRGAALEAQGFSSPLSDIVLGPDGALLDDAILQADTIPALAFMQLDQVAFEGEAISAWGRIPLPASFAGDVLVEPLRVYSDGRLEARVSTPILRGDSEGFSWELDGVSVESSGSGLGLSAEQAHLVLGESLGGARLDASGLSLDANGFSVRSLSGSPFDFFGVQCSLDSLYLGAQRFSCSGSIELPELLDYTRLDIEEFTIAHGKVEALRARADAHFRIPLFPGIAFDLWNPFIDYDGSLRVGFETCSASLGEAFPTASLRVENLALSLPSCVPEFDRITLEGFTFTRDGVEFVLTEGSLSKSGALKFSGALRVVDNPPAWLKNASIVIKTLEIDPDGKLLALEGVLEGVSFALSEDVNVENASVSLCVEGQSVLVKLAGSIVLGQDFPKGVAGTRLAIKKCVFDVGRGRFKEISAECSAFSVAFEGGVGLECSRLAFSCGEDWSRATLACSGALVLPESLPGALSKARVVIQSFVMHGDGSVETADVALKLAPHSAFIDSTYLDGARVGIKYKQGTASLELAGTVVFPATSSLPEFRLSLRKCSFDTNGVCKSLDAALTMASFDLGGGTILRDASLHLTAAGGDLRLGLAGSLELSKDLPEGLAGLRVQLRRLVCTASGNIVEFDAGLTGIEAPLFGLATWKKGFVNVALGSQGDFLFSLGGSLVLSQTFPVPIAGTEFVLSNFVVSSRRGIISGGLAMNRDLEIPLFAGVSCVVGGLGIGSDGLSLAAKIRFASSMPEGLAGLEIGVESMRIDWSGKIADLKAGLIRANMKLSGFEFKLSRLLISPKGVSIGEALLRLPQGLGSLSGQWIGLRNAAFDDAGRFHADIVAPELSFDFAGFTLSFVEPQLSFEKRQISFKRAQLRAPPILGSVAIALEGLQIGADGAKLAGLGLTLPDFSVDSLLSFKNVHVTIAFDNGQYALEGGGAAFIAGLGTVAAEVAFTNPSGVYPLGLRRAYFSFAFTPGLPLGTSGCNLTRIAGGIAFGPPDEVPDQVRWLFHDPGTRLQLGVSISGGPGGSFVQGDVESWLDLRNIAWGLQGKATFLSGTLDIHTDITAAISDRGFYAGIGVHLVFLDGKAELWIWKPDGLTRVAGRGSLAFKIPKNSILGFLPFGDWTLASVYAELGVFSNGETGAKAWIDFGWPIGSVGVFWNGSTFVTKDIDTITLSLPEGARSRAQQAVVSRAADVRLASRAPDDRTFVVGGGASRIIVGLRSSLTCPTLVLVDPAGKEYRSDDASLPCLVDKQSLVAAIEAPVAGTWTARAENVEAGEQVEFFVWNAPRKPWIRLDEPSSAVARGEGGFRFAGRASEGTSGEPVEIYALPLDPLLAPIRIASGKISSELGFSLRSDAADLPPGRYHVEARLGGDGPPVVASGSGTLVCTGHPALAVCTSVSLSRQEGGLVRVDFSDPNGVFSHGYRVSIVYESGELKGREELVDCGLVNPVVYPLSASDAAVSVAVAAVDTESNAGPWSPRVRLQALSDPSPARISLRCSDAGAELRRGDAATTLTFTSSCSLPGASVVYQVRDVSHGLVASVGGERQRAGPFGVLVRLADDAGLGTASFVLRVSLAEDPRIWAETEVSLRSVNPPLQVSKASPASISVAELSGVVDCVVSGSGFVKGTRLFCGESEVPIATMSPHALRFVLPQGLTSRGLCLRGLDGQEVAVPLEVRYPAWETVQLVSRRNAHAGDTMCLPIMVRGIDTDDPPPSPPGLEVPGGWNVSESHEAVEGGTLYFFRLDVPADARGRYRLSMKESPESVIDIDILEGPMLVRSLSSSRLFAGDTLYVFGEGFGRLQGEVRNADHRLQVLSWSDDVLKLVLDSRAKSGPLVVLSRTGQSASIAINVAQRAFSLVSTESEVELEAEGQRSVGLSLRGTGGRATVSFTIDRLSSQGQEPRCEILGSFAAIPASGSLRVTMPADFSGRCEVRIKAVCGGVTVEKILGISSAEIHGLCVPDRVVLHSGRPCTVSLVDGASARNAYAWSLEAGVLPEGLALSAGGELSGTPRVRGSFPVTLSVSDGGSRRTRALVQVEVEGSTWTGDQGDAGRTSANDSDIPSRPRVAWSSVAIPGASSLLSDNIRVYVRSAQEIAALSMDTGRILWKRSIASRDWQFFGASLYVLRADGTLDALDAATGNLGGRLEDVEGILADSKGLLLVAKDGVFRWNGEGSPALLFPQRIDVARICSLDGNVYFSSGSDVFLVRAGTSVRVCSAPWLIATMACDASGFVVSSKDGQIQASRLDGGLIARYEAHDAFLSAPTVFEAGICVETRGSLLYLSRGLELLHKDEHPEPASYNRVYASRFAVIESGPGGQRWESRASSGELFRSDEPAIASFGLDSRVFALLSGGEVRAYAGDVNSDAPVTKFVVEAPDGDESWYRHPPALSVIATDREGPAIAELELDGVRIDQPSSRDGASLKDGVYHFEAYSQDAYGVPGASATLDLRIDSTPPRSSVSYDSTPLVGTDGVLWFHSSTEIRIAAEDGLSGVIGIMLERSSGPGLRAGNSYLHVLKNEGQQSLEWYARDRAGNCEELRVLKVGLDHSAPTVVVRAASGEASLRVTVSAEDDASGIREIQIALDGDDPVSRGTADVCLELTPATHTVRVRALNEAGLMSAWTTCVFSYRAPSDSGVLSIANDIPPIAPPLILLEARGQGSAALSWAYRLHNASGEPLDDSKAWIDVPGGLLRLPAFAGQRVLEVRAIANGAGATSEARASYTIQDRSRILTQSFGDGMPLLAGEVFLPEARAFTSAGLRVPDSDLVWSFSFLPVGTGNDEVRVPAEDDGSFVLPAIAGTLVATATWPAYRDDSGHIIQTQRTFRMPVRVHAGEESVVLSGQTLLDFAIQKIDVEGRPVVNRDTWGRLGAKGEEALVWNTGSGAWKLSVHFDDVPASGLSINGIPFEVRSADLEIEVRADTDGIIRIEAQDEPVTVKSAKLEHLP